MTGANKNALTNFDLLRLVPIWTTFFCWASIFEFKQTKQNFVLFLLIEEAQMELFAKTVKWLLADNYFRKKAQSWIFDRVLT